MELNIDYKIAVALRRIIMQNIPHYCYGNIIINENNTLLDNDHIKRRIMTIPVESIYIDLKKLKKIDEKNIFNNELNENDRKSFDEIKITCSKKYENNNKDFIQSVTTNDCTFYLNGNKIKNPMKYNIKIVDLKYDTDSIDFTVLTDVGIPLNNINYSVSETVILTPSSKNCKLVINPKNEILTSKTILENAIYILKIKLDYFLKNMEDDVSSKKGKIKIQNDLFTIGYLYSYYLNKNKEINFCSINIDTLIKKDSYLNFVINEKSKSTIKNIIKSINKEISKELSNIKI